MTPGEKGVRTQLFHTPPIDAETLLPELKADQINKVHWESFTSWEDVAKQQGSIERVLFNGGGDGKSAAAGAAGKKDKEEGEKDKGESKKGTKK